MNLEIKIYKSSLFMIFCIVLLYLSLIDGIPYGSYIDDIIPLILGCIWLKGLFEKKKFTEERNMFYLLLIVLLIGLISNLYASVVGNIKNILMDLFSYMKIFFVYLGVAALLKNRTKAQKSIIECVGKLSKYFLILSFIFGILNLFGFVKLSQQVRFGINTFCFVYSNASQFGILVAVALGFVIMRGGRRIKFYEIIGLSTLLMTMKGMSIIIIAVYVGMNFFRTKKIKFWHILLMGVILLIALRYQLYTYLLNKTAPRAVLLKYGFVTANSYFPFGAGFGSYGSNIAGKYYSPLYVKYGFTDRLSLLYGENTALNDAYLAMILGQFGYIGTIVHYIIFLLIGKNILNAQRNNYKAFYITVSYFVCILGLSVMAGSLKGTIGQLMMIVIQLYCLNNKREGRIYA